MSIRNETIINATTSLAFSKEFSVLGCATITAGPLAVNEGVQIQYSNNGLDWYSLYLNGILQEITAEEHSIITVHGPGKFRCLKSVTASACSVNLWESETVI